MDIGDAGLLSVVGVGLGVVVVGLLLAAVSFFSMKETSFEDVLAKQKRKKEEQDKERTRLNKQKREMFKQKLKRRKAASGGGNVENGKILMDGVSLAHEVQIKPSEPVHSEVQLPKKKNKSKPVTPEIKTGKSMEKKEALLFPEVQPEVKVAVPKIKEDVEPKQVVENVVESVEPRKVLQEPLKSDAGIEIETKAVLEPQKPVVVDEVEPTAAVDPVEDTTVQKAKKKKSKKSGDDGTNAIFDIVRSATLDQSATQGLIRILTEQQDQFEYAAVGTTASAIKKKVAELETQLSNKDSELKLADSNLLSSQQRIQQLNDAIQQEKSQREAENSEHLKVMTETAKLNAELKSQLESNSTEYKQNIATLEDQVKHSAVNFDSMKKVKEENEILKLTIQGNAKEVADKQRLATELNNIKAQLQETELARNDLELKLSEFSGSFQQRQAEVEGTYSQRIDEMTAKLHDAHSQYTALESEFQKAQTDLQLNQNETAKLLSQVVLLTEANEQKGVIEGEYNSLVEASKALEERVLEMDASEARRADQLAKLDRSNKELDDELEKARAESKTLREQLESLQQVSDDKMDVEQHNTFATDKQAEIDSLQAKISQVEADFQKANDESTDLQSKISQLEAELQASNDAAATLKTKNNELREKNWKAMDAVSATEQNARDQIAKSEKAADDMLSGVRSQVQELLRSTFPLSSCDEKNFDAWLPEFLKSVKDSQVASSSAQQDTAKLEINHLQEDNQTAQDRITELSDDAAGKLAEVEKYKTILSTTEETLKQLQKTAESEENLRQVQAEKDQQQITELRESLAEADKKLNEKTSEVMELKKECDLARQERTKTQTELEAIRQKFTEIESSLRAEKELTQSSMPPVRDMRSGDASDNSVDSPFRQRGQRGDADMTSSSSGSSSNGSGSGDDHGFLIIDQNQLPSAIESPPPAEIRDEKPEQSDAAAASSLQNGNDEEVAKLKERLEKEKQLTKSLGAAASKLQAVLKQTQEQLNLEREKNKEAKTTMEDDPTANEVD